MHNIVFLSEFVSPQNHLQKQANKLELRANRSAFVYAYHLVLYKVLL